MTSLGGSCFPPSFAAHSIAEKDPLEIYVDGGSIILQKHEERCVFCGGSEDLRTVLGKNICGSCLSRLKKTRT